MTRYRHYKGGIYEYIDEAILEVDLTPMIIYRAAGALSRLSNVIPAFAGMTGRGKQPSSCIAAPHAYKNAPQ